MKKILFLVLAIFLVSGCVVKDKGTNTSESESVSKSEIDKVLNLSGQNLAKLDFSIFARTSLEELNVSNNNLTDALPSQIGKLKNLKVLNASDNQMTGVPSEIGQLSNLETLNLSNNQITGLPNELGNLKNLKVLNLSGNEYSTQDLDLIKGKLPNVNFILN